MATQLRAKPSEMLAASSNPESDWLKAFMFPSGSVMLIIVGCSPILIISYYTHSPAGTTTTGKSVKSISEF
jgi:hypothetical protein